MPFFPIKPNEKRQKIIKEYEFVDELKYKEMKKEDIILTFDYELEKAEVNRNKEKLMKFSTAKDCSISKMLNLSCQNLENIDLE